MEGRTDSKYENIAGYAAAGESNLLHFGEGSKSGAATDDNSGSQFFQFSESMNSIIERIGVRLQSKYRKATDAFRGIDLDGDGTVNMKENRIFFLEHQYKTDTADEFFYTLDKNREGYITRDSFLYVFGPFLSRERQDSHPRVKSKKKHAELSNECALMLEAVGAKLSQKYNSAKDCYRLLDRDRDHKVSLDELRFFFKNHGWAKSDADFFFYEIADVQVDPDNVSMARFQHIMSAFVNFPTHPRFNVPDDPLLEADIEKLSKKLAVKYKDVRTAVRNLDGDRDGTIGFEEMANFVAFCGFQREFAERIFRHLDADTNSSINYLEFQRWLGMHIHPGENESEVDPHKRPENKVRDSAVTRTIEAIGQKADQKYKNMRNTFKTVVHENGRVTRTELHRFFRNFGYRATEANILFEELRTDDSGTIDMLDLQACFKPYIGHGTL
jgi:Ca2+-binding EF-hand superfamily protein